MTATTNSQPLKILLQKCKSWDLIENIFLCLSLVLIDLQRHTVPHFKDKFIINNSFYQIEAIREKLLSLDLDIGVAILFLAPYKESIFLTAKYVLTSQLFCSLFSLSL